MAILGLLTALGLGKAATSVLRTLAKDAINSETSKLFMDQAKTKAATIIRNMSSNPPSLAFTTLIVSSPSDYVYHVELNRPEKRNAINNTMWKEIGDCFAALAENPECRVIVLSGAGDKSFSAGLDLHGMLDFGNEVGQHDDIARKGSVIMKYISLYQNSISSLEKCPKPVIAAIHGDCVGAGTDMVTAADVRLCSKDAYFQVKEVDIGMAADVGTLQRLPKVIGSTSLVNELAYTGRKLLSDEAKSCGLVSQVFNTKETLLQKSLELAQDIAKKSPVAVQTIKRSLIYSRDHSVEEGLAHIALMNVTMIQSEDFLNAIAAAATKSNPPTFSKL